VAAGLAAYFGLDVVLIRILFVLSVLAWGWGILVYLVLWLLVPEAKTSSDRLRMAGKPVNLDTLKEVVERADVKGAATRANKSLAGTINSVFGVLVKAVGIGLTGIGLGLLIGLLAGAGYLAIHGNIVMDNIFPIGFKEHLMVYIAAAVALLTALFVVLFGVAIYKRKWPIRTWLTGVLIGLTIIGIAGGSALAADAAPRIRDRYNAHFHTIIRNVQPFTNVAINGPGNIVLQAADKYYVSIKYYDQSNPSAVTTKVSNGTLFVNTQGYQWDRPCSSVCIPNHYDLTVTIYTPNPQDLQPDGKIPDFPKNLPSLPITTP
jgi:phage shock protein PspC (stress-responsive transcriptional regulator)